MKDQRVEQWLKQEGVEWHYEPDVPLTKIDREASLKNQAGFKAINQDHVLELAIAAEQSEMPALVGYYNTERRGRNCRMDSYQSLWKHFPTKSAVMRHVMRYASEEIAKSHFIFRYLHDCGLTSVDEFLETARQMSEERNLRQEEKERREREEAKKRTEQRVRDIIEEMRGRKPWIFSTR